MSDSGLRLKITLDDAKAREAIAGIIRRAGSLKVPFNSIGNLLLARVHEHFEKQESPTGEPWRALAASTEREYARIGARGKLLMRTFPARKGRRGKILKSRGSNAYELFNSITYAADDTTLAIGSNLKFAGGKSAAAIHQLGGQAGRGAEIPARPFLGMNTQDEQRATDILMNYLVGIS